MLLLLLQLYMRAEMGPMAMGMGMMYHTIEPVGRWFGGLFTLEGIMQAV